MGTKEQTLHLTLKKKWFDMIDSGIKDEEYREVKAHWIKRILDKFSWDINEYPIKINASKKVFNKGSYTIKSFNSVRFRNGYAKNAPVMEFKVKSITIGRGYSPWGAPLNEDVFIIKLGERIYEN